MAPSSNSPFGFSPGSGDVPDDLARKIPLFAELQKLLASSGPVNWELARQAAIASAAPGERAVTTREADSVVEAVRLAELWLDPATTLPPGATATEAWTRVRWIEATQPTWQTLCDPVAERVVGAMGATMPEEVRTAAAAMLPALGMVGGLLFGAQLGQALGSLAGEVVGTTDIGLPLGPTGVAALLPAGVDAFADGLEVPPDEVRLFLALREAAHHRLYGHVTWLRRHVLDAIDAYARGITVDQDAIGRALADIDPMDPESLQRALGGGLFQPESTPAQQAALARLENALALIEGWVSVVVEDAARPHLPSTAALAETMRRRRASGGPAEHTFATLVGLELRPRRLREAADAWRRLGAAGAEQRDAAWAHPDLVPDLDEPEPA